jgi:hypothetical protein
MNNVTNKDNSYFVLEMSQVKEKAASDVLIKSDNLAYVYDINYQYLRLI